jgi:hypothetical protein
LKSTSGTGGVCDGCPSDWRKPPSKSQKPPEGSLASLLSKRAAGMGSSGPTGPLRPRRRATRKPNRIKPRGHVAQWESARFTRERSVVRNHPCPLRYAEAARLAVQLATSPALSTVCRRGPRSSPRSPRLRVPVARCGRCTRCRECPRHVGWRAGSKRHGRAYRADSQRTQTAKTTHSSWRRSARRCVLSDANLGRTQGPRRYLHALDDRACDGRMGVERASPLARSRSGCRHRPLRCRGGQEVPQGRADVHRARPFSSDAGASQPRRPRDG